MDTSRDSGIELTPLADDMEDVAISTEEGTTISKQEDSRPATPPVTYAAPKLTQSSSIKARLAMFEQQSPKRAAVSQKSSPSKPKYVRPSSVSSVTESATASILEGDDLLRPVSLSSNLVETPIASTSKLEPIPPSPTASPGPTDTNAVTIFGIVLVDFDHALGPKVEFAYPSHLKDDPELSTSLPFLALPDGAHMRDEDYSYFHILSPTISPSTVFGISCNRQISADQLLNRKADVTRSTVQKAIVVLASKPVFGPIRDKLGVITRAFFAQKDFGETSILVDFFASLESGLGGGHPSGSNSRAAVELEENAMYMGTSLRELIYKFRFKTLMLLKLLMLQKKVMFYGSQVERLCTYQYSLVSLIPCLLLNLEDAASPMLDERSRHTERPTELRTSDRKSLLRYLGLPLNIFGKDAFFQPYLPLQQIDLLHATSYLVGTTNSIFQQQRDCKIDVLVNVDTAAIEFLDPSVATLVNLTAPDRKWMDDLVTTVSDSWNAADPARPVGMKFIGSDDFLRAKFEEYICSALSAIKFVDYLGKGKEADVLLSGADIHSGLTSYNEAWIKSFKQSPAFELWDRTTDAAIFDLVEPRHPCEGQTHLVQDVGIRLNQGLHDLHLEENLAPAREVITKSIASGSEGVWKFYSSVKGDITKRQLDYKEKREKELKAEPTTEEGTFEGTSPAPPLLSTHVLAGVNEAGSRASSLATSVGSFLSSKKSSFFASRAPSEPTITSTTPTDSVLSPAKMVLSDSPLTPDTFPPSSTFSSPMASASIISKTAAPISASTSSNTAASPFSSFFRTASESQSTFPSFFRRTSGTSSAPAPPPLKELSLGSPATSPIMRANPSPRLSPRLSPRPASSASFASNPSSGDSRSARNSKEMQDVAI